jgi:hypothetical protein
MIGHAGEVGLVVALPEGKSWLTEPEEPLLFVRKCYRPLYELCKEIRNQNPHRGGGVILSGNPGIGKSWCLNAFLVWFLQDGFRVIYQRVSVGDVIVFCQDGTILYEQGYDLHLVHNYGQNVADTIYLFDPDGSQRVQPFQVPAFTLIAPSPKLENYKQFSKRVEFTRYIPIWSLEELKIYREACEIRINCEELEKRYAIFGGIPRSVFTNNFKTTQTALETAIVAFDMTGKMRGYFQFGMLPNSDTAHAQGSHKVIHVNVNDEYEADSLDFNSVWIQEKVLEHELRTRGEEYLKFFKVALNFPSSKLLAGFMYDYFVKQLISKRKPNEWRADNPGASKKLLKLIQPGDQYIPEGNTVYWNKYPSGWIVPAGSGFPAADVLLKAKDGSLLAFSVTVSLKHDFKILSLMKNIKGFKWQGAGEKKNYEKLLKSKAEREEIKKSCKKLIEVQKKFYLIWLLPDKETAEGFERLGASNEHVLVWCPDNTDVESLKQLGEAVVRKRKKN